MMCSAPISLARVRIILYMALGVLKVVLLCFRIGLRRLVWISCSLVVMVVLSGWGFRSMGHLRRPPMGGGCPRRCT